MSESYSFPGITKFVSGEGVRPSFEAKVTSSWLMSRLVDALAQIPPARPEHRAEMFAEARAVILAMNSCTLTATAAFDEVFRMAPPLPSPDDPAPSSDDPFTATRQRPTGHSEPIPADDDPRQRKAK
jgi:hypothetical protein